MSSVLAGTRSLPSVVQNVGLDLAAVAAGPEHRSGTVHGPDRYVAVIRELAAGADVVVVDAAGRRSVAGLVDVTVVVAAAGTTRRRRVRRTVDALGRAGGRPVGIVLDAAGAAPVR